MKYIEMVELRDNANRPLSYWINGKQVDSFGWWKMVFGTAGHSNFSKYAYPATRAVVERMNDLLEYPLSLEQALPLAQALRSRSR